MYNKFHMKNVNPELISIHTTPADLLSTRQVQQWCQQKLLAGQGRLTVWFFAEAVYHLLQPAAEEAEEYANYLAWKELAAAGIRLKACSAACQRRELPGYLQQEVFEISSLTQWADQVISNESKVICVLSRPLKNIKFIREQIDPVMVLLALGIQVTVVFQPEARNHLLDEAGWRQWRMLPELEDAVRLIVVSEGIDPHDLQQLRTRPAVQIEPEARFAGKVIYV